jgi:hypothetical protein
MRYHCWSSQDRSFAFLPLLLPALDIASFHLQRGRIEFQSLPRELGAEKEEGEYKGKQSNVILTTQGESTLKIFGE